VNNTAHHRTISNYKNIYILGRSSEYTNCMLLWGDVQSQNHILCLGGFKGR